MDYWHLPAGASVSTVEQRHLAYEAKGVSAAAVIPAAVVQHHTVLVFPPLHVVVGLISVPVGILEFTPCSNKIL